MLLVDFVLGGGQVAGVGIERLEQPVQRAGGDVIDVGLGNVVGLDPFEYLLKDAHLAIGSIGLAAGMNAKPAELANKEAKAEGGKDRDGKHEDKTLDKSRHTHHRGGP